jgi:hypothetical protein
MACPAIEWDKDLDSSGTLSVLSGGNLTICGITRATRETQTVCELKLAPDQPAVIGRAEGHPVPYLDPAYRATRLLPGTGQSIMHPGEDESNGFVSRGHFMLRWAAGGILLINGVPRLGGGIRPPLNGTFLLEPVRRVLGPAEEYLIASGTSIVLWLPNHTRVRIAAR